MFNLNKYIIDQKLISLRDTYLIKDIQESEIGKVEGKLVSFGSQFRFLDLSGQTVAHVREEVLKFRKTFHILDADENLVVTMRKTLFTLVAPEYWFEDPDGNEILRAKGKFHAYQYALFDPQGEMAAEITKEWVSLQDSYGVEILSSVDPLIVLSAVICIDNIEHNLLKKS
ncbi:MAG: LURP-one-related family protein [Chloroflexota bacterium]